MKHLLMILLCNISLCFASEDFFDILEVQKDGIEIVKNLGLNCGTPNNYPIFVEEFYKFIKGLGITTSELALQSGTAKNYPNVCAVLTQNQINSYQETPEVSHDRKCVLRPPKPIKGCMAYNNIKITQPRATYYWPKYLIEVSEKGNDFDPSFLEGNILFKLNRKISLGLGELFDVGGVAKLAAMYSAAGSVANASGIGMKFDGNELSGIKAVALDPMEKMRVQSSSGKVKHFEANIWPIVASRAFAENLTVCGGQIADLGGDPGGYSWPFKGVPMTCPTAMSVDAYSYWDSGILDYFDPEAMSSLASSVNPLTCGMAQATEYFNNESSLKNEKAGDQQDVNKSIGSSGGNLKLSLSNCSFPILGTSEAIAKKTLSMGSARKWNQVKCTLWGNIAPRSGLVTYESDYSYANTALKFKLFSHELFGVPRGNQERWSLAYPWEGAGAEIDKSKDETSFIDKYFGSFGESIKKITDGKLNMNIVENANRSTGLFSVGDPRFINASSSGKLFKERVGAFAKEGAVLGAMTATTMGLDPISKAGAWSALEYQRYKKSSMGEGNELGGNRRIFTVWEKITCVNKTKKIENSFPPVTEYSSCRDAIKYEVYKYVQLKFTRKMCNFIGYKEGYPWK